MPPIIFFNIGWMKEYRGETEDDRVISNFGYVVEHGTGHEQCNFLPLNGIMYGYFPLPWNESRDEPNSLRIERIGAGKRDESISGVTAVFFSKHPFEGTTRIVGWYKNATVYRSPQTAIAPRRILNKDIFRYYVTADESDCVCLPELERKFKIPTRNDKVGGYGQSPVWYADKLPKFQKEVLSYIEGKNQNQPSQNTYSSDANLSAADKKKIEQTAINFVTEHYEEKGYTVKSVERDNCGWDLTVTKENQELYVEVKGTARNFISFQLTPNEYRKLKKHCDKYFIATVRSCLRQPIVEIFKMSKISRSKNSLYKGISTDGTEVYLAERIEVHAFATL